MVLLSILIFFVYAFLFYLRYKEMRDFDELFKKMKMLDKKLDRIVSKNYVDGNFK